MSSALLPPDALYRMVSIRVTTHDGSQMTYKEMMFEIREGDQGIHQPEYHALPWLMDEHSNPILFPGHQWYDTATPMSLLTTIYALCRPLVERHGLQAQIPILEETLDRKFSGAYNYNINHPHRATNRLQLRIRNRKDNFRYRSWRRIIKTFLHELSHAWVVRDNIPGQQGHSAAWQSHFDLLRAEFAWMEHLATAAFPQRVWLSSDSRYQRYGDFGFLQLHGPMNLSPRGQRIEALFGRIASLAPEATSSPS